MYAPCADVGNTEMAKGGRVRRAFRVSGIVQGVGFRPFVYRLALRYALGGWVLNDSAGVGIEAEGAAEALDAFAAALRKEAPLAAVVASVTFSELPPTGEEVFRILPSPTPLRTARTAGRATRLSRVCHTTAR